MAHTYDPVGQLNQLTQGIEFAMLTTVRPDGTLHSCPMAAPPAGPDGIIWLLSNGNSEKVEAVRTSQRVNLAYADHAGQRYISISGFCELVRDRVKTKELWNSQYRTWFPGGAEDPNLVLLKINIQQASYWDASHSRMTELFGFAQAGMGA